LVGCAKELPAPQPAPAREHSILVETLEERERWERLGKKLEELKGLIEKTEREAEKGDQEQRDIHGLPYPHSPDDYYLPRALGGPS
jgi:hypothetical protein